MHRLPGDAGSGTSHLSLAPAAWVKAPTAPIMRERTPRSTSGRACTATPSWPRGTRPGWLGWRPGLGPRSARGEARHLSARGLSRRSRHLPPSDAALLSAASRRYTVLVPARGRLHYWQGSLWRRRGPVYCIGMPGPAGKGRGPGVPRRLRCRGGGQMTRGEGLSAPKRSAAAGSTLLSPLSFFSLQSRAAGPTLARGSREDPWGVPLEDLSQHSSRAPRTPWFFNTLLMLTPWFH